MMRVGRLQDAASLLLVLLGALLVLGALLNPLSVPSWPIPDTLLYLLLGIALWRSGQLVRRGLTHGYALGVAGLAILLLTPLFLGRTPTAGGLLFDLAMLAVVVTAWWIGRYTPAPPIEKPRRAVVLRAVGWTLAALGILLIGSLVAGTLWLVRSYSVPHGVTVFDVVPGTWAWTSTLDGCRTDPETIRFGPDHTTMTIAFNRAFRTATGRVDSIAHYVVLSSSPSRLRARIPGERRMTAAGQPVVWDLVLRTKDRFAWHRTDWQWWGFTADLARCSQLR